MTKLVIAFLILAAIIGLVSFTVWWCRQPSTGWE